MTIKTSLALSTVAAFALLLCWGTLAIQTGGSVEAKYHDLILRIEGSRR
jgi:hypothetical protein